MPGLCSRVIGSVYSDRLAYLSLSITDLSHGRVTQIYAVSPLDVSASIINPFASALCLADIHLAGLNMPPARFRVIEASSRVKARGA